MILTYTRIVKDVHLTCFKALKVEIKVKKNRDFSD